LTQPPFGFLCYIFKLLTGVITVIFFLVANTAGFVLYRHFCE
jgi:hypothetical protein